MGRIAMIGAWPNVRGWALAGVDAIAAEGPAEIRAAWHTLDPDIAIVLLTQQAAGELADELLVAPVEPGTPLVVVIPA